MSDTSMTIAWLPPLDDGGLEIIDYTVEKKETNKKAWQKVGILWICRSGELLGRCLYLFFCL